MKTINKLKGTGLFILFAFSFCNMVSAQKIVADDYNGLTVTFNVDKPTIGEVTLDGITFATVNLDGYFLSETEGNPALPEWSHLIEVPLCSGYDVEVKGAVYDTMQLPDMLLMPMQPSRSKSDTAYHPISFNKRIYQQDAFISHQTALVQEVGISRDRKLARLQFSPVSYNPVQHKLIVCRQATVCVTYRDADRKGTLAMFERYHSPVFASGLMAFNSLYPKSVRTTAPVRYLIVAHSQFRGQLDEFIQWKRRKGFITDIVYTDDPNVGTTTTSIQSYIQSQYTNATAASPAPTYLLLVGDVAQIPAFDGTTQNSHITDLYYTTWTSGDHLPDCYHGRFSAQNLSQLQPQIDKTLMYEQYTFADPSFLDRAVMVAGVDGGNAGDFGYTHADPAMDYAVTNYINGSHGWTNVYYFKNNTSIVPTGSNVTMGSSSSGNAANVRTRYNEGAGWINYSAHGGSTGWGTPSFGNSHVSQMSNVQKFGILIGNCCQTNMFGESTCFGEALLRKDNYCGAVGYIGGSDYTYWGEDFYWAVGVRSGISATMSMAYNSSNLGAYDRLCHTHNEAYSQWVASQGALMMAGNMAVESSTSGLKHYYWEIYHLMGDPSVMTWLTQADTMDVTVQTTLVYGTSTLTVSAEPYSYVALTDTATRTLKAAAYAGSTGQVTLTLPTNLPLGGYELAVSAQQYRTAFRSISVVQPDGAFPTVSAVTPATLVAGDTATLSVTIANPGNAMAHNIVAQLSSSNPALQLLTDSIHLDSLAANGQHVRTITAVISPLAADGTSVMVSSSSTWNGTTMPAVSNTMLTINAPRLQVGITPDIISMQPGQSCTLTVSIANNGHASLPSGRMLLLSPTSMLAVTPQASMPTLQAGGDMNLQFTVSASTSLPTDISLPIALSLDGPLPIYNAILPVHIGQPWFEAFDGAFSLSGWTQDASHPWTFTNENVWQGSSSARSYQGLNHNESSEMQLTVNIPFADSVSFNYAVSSEGGYDKFHFYIDTTELVVASGDIDWTRASFPITAGTHTLRFSYTKDYSVSNGSDCAWIDMLMLPHTARPVTASSVDLCQGQLYISGGDTVNTTQPASLSIVHEGANMVTIEDITVHPAVYNIDTVEACDSYTWNGVEFTSSCNTVSAYNDANGCDSVIGLRLTIHHSSSQTLLVEGCDSCVWNNVTYTASTNMSISNTNIHGCDSSLSVKIRVYHPTSSTEAVTTTETSYEWNGNTYTESGTYTVVLSTVHGCDSTVTLTLTIDPTVGIDDIQASPLTVQLYPNPASDRITLSRDADLCQLYDIDGRLMAEYKNTRQLDLGALPRGVYMLHVTVGEATATLRLVLR